MKTTLFSIFVGLLTIFTVAANTFAQDDATSGLPEGAKARLGRGKITAGVIAVAMSPDGQTIASGSANGVVYLWDANTNNHLHTLTGHRDTVNSLSFSPDGTIVASGSYDDTARLWDVNTGSHLRTLTGHADWIRDVSFSPDGTIIATASGDRTVRFWDVNTGNHFRTFTGHTHWVRSVSFSPDGTIIASGSYDSTARLWDTKTGNEIHILAGHTDAIVGVSYSPDGTTVATASWDGTARVWDAKTGSHLRTFTGHTNDVDSVAFGPDSNTIVTGSKDATVLVWELNPSTSTMSDATEPERPKEDVTGDNIVNIQDLVLVASSIGKSGSNRADVNGDGIVNIQDLVLVAGALDTTASAPALNAQTRQTFTAADVEKWLQEARQFPLTDPAFQRGVLILEQLLATLTPKQTALLPNYPNPFNPETWIPYQLAKPADVKIAIYTADGTLVRRLILGTQGVGIYESRSRAAYWDGKNAFGESVASGLYFYTLTAGNFEATRRMLILK